ncbi:endonuclease/exonuclease/phosphatase family protein [Kribbella sp. NPDC058693]|uniref:endonuclease/exonuclease/phosphatase family protein n=1 Tax=Kribbella sp. NPDC058693 TaxID=3346602 RepID=UPI00365B1085
MTTIVTPPGAIPADAAADLDRIKAALKLVIPEKTIDNLLIGSWNIRAFGGLAPRWNSVEGDSPRRDWHALACIAAVIDRFDVTAVQETRRDTTALIAVLSLLGPHYHVIASDVTAGDPGGDERLAYIYDSRRLQPSGLVGEIVLPAGANGPIKQFARTPYAAGFVRGNTDFILTTVHVVWGDGPRDRIDEVTAFATWMRSWANRPKDWNHNLLVLGDFNLDRLGNPLFEAFVSTGLWPPSELDMVPRTIFDNPHSHHFYDQVAWFNDPTKPGLPSLLDGLTYTHRAGNFDFVPHILTDLDKTRLSWRISDHYPLWLEFAVS